jgi:hypothetical protein
MIVTVVLPDKRQGDIQIDPTASIDEIKRVIVTDLGLGRVEDFVLAISTSDESTAVGDIKLREKGLIWLIDLKSSRNPVQGLGQFK